MKKENQINKKSFIQKEKKLGKKHYFLLIGLIIFGVVYHSFVEPKTLGHDKRYLIYIVLLPIILGVLILGFYRRQFLITQFTAKRGFILWTFMALFYLSQGLIFSYLSLGQITKLSWDYLNYQTANNNTEEVFNCKVSRFWQGKRPSIDFKLNNRNESINVSYPTIKEFENKKEKDYYIRIIASKGIWNYYILKDWEIAN